MVSSAIRMRILISRGNLGATEILYIVLGASWALLATIHGRFFISDTGDFVSVWLLRGHC